MNLNDFVVSSRVRLARNIEGMPFPSKLKDKRAHELAKAVQANLKGFSLLPMKDMDDISMECLKEQHLISPALMENKPFGSLVLNKDRSVSIMVCEEDCIRAQAIFTGFNFEDAFQTIDEIDDSLAKNIRFSYDDTLGYLTACPTNLGTGMRISAMMFLPALTMSKDIHNVINSVSRIDITIRGVYGEGSTAEGYLYQISNQKSLGVTEQELIANVSAAVNHIAALEERAREELMNKFEITIMDKIMRSYGILTNSYSMDSAEFMEQIALLKLGRYYKIFRDFDQSRLEHLIIEAKPYSLQKIAERPLDQTERDLFRSEYIAKELAKLDIR